MGDAPEPRHPGHRNWNGAPWRKSLSNGVAAGHEKDSWLPSGEARTRAVASSAAFAAEGKELLLTSQDDGCCMVRETVDNAVSLRGRG